MNPSKTAPTSEDAQLTRYSKQIEQWTREDKLVGGNISTTKQCTCKVSRNTHWTNHFKEPSKIVSNWEDVQTN